MNQIRPKLIKFLVASISLLVTAFAVSFGVDSWKMRQHIAGKAVQAANDSGLLSRQIGTPIKMGHFVSGRVIGGMDSGTADLQIPISGPNGTGELLYWGQNSFGGWRVCSLTFRPKTGKEVIIVPDETATCERE